MKIEDESSNESETCNAGDFQLVFEDFLMAKICNVRFTE